MSLLKSGAPLMSWNLLPRRQKQGWSLPAGQGNPCCDFPSSLKRELMLLRVRHVWVLLVCPLLGRKWKNMSRMRLIICTLKVAIFFPWFSKELGLISSGIHFLLKVIPPVSGLLSRPLLIKLDLQRFHFHDFIYTRQRSTPAILPYLIPLALQHAGFPETLQDQSQHCTAVVVTVLDTKRKFSAQEKDWGKDAEGFS